MAEAVPYIQFDDDERRVLGDAAIFVRSLGEERARLINSAVSGEPMAAYRVQELAVAIYSAMHEQKVHAATVTEHGHEDLVPTYKQNIDQRLVPAYQIVTAAIEKLLS